MLMMRRWFSQHWRLRTGRNYFCCFVSPQKTTVSCPRRLSFIRMGWQSQRRAQGRRQVPCCQPHTVRKHRMDLKWKPIDLETYNFSYISQVYLSLRGFGRMREVLLYDLISFLSEYVGSVLVQIHQSHLKWTFYPHSSQAYPLKTSNPKEKKKGKKTPI